MKALIISDLHVDFAKDPLFVIKDDFAFDVAIVAGDIANHAKETLRYMKKFKKIVKNKPVFMVAGNHDRWSLSFEESEKYLSQIDGYLNRKIVELNGQRFLGCTLWYKPEKEFSRKDWSDYRYIKDFEQIQKEHELDMLFLADNLQEGDVVITHMLPSYECISPKYIGDLYNKFYVTEIMDLIKERKPKLWISGHSHEFMYKNLTKDTLFVRNPFGYPSERKYTTEFIIINLNDIKLYDSVSYLSHVPEERLPLKRKKDVTRFIEKKRN